MVADLGETDNKDLVCHEIFDDSGLETNYDSTEAGIEFNSNTPIPFPFCPGPDNILLCHLFPFDESDDLFLDHD
jgi:hypothetical protein